MLSRNKSQSEDAAHKPVMGKIHVMTWALQQGAEEAASWADLDEVLENRAAEDQEMRR